MSGAGRFCSMTQFHATHDAALSLSNFNDSNLLQIVKNDTVLITISLHRQLKVIYRDIFIAYYEQLF